MARIALALLAISAPLFSGCGTFADSLAGPADDHVYYRGVRMDFAGIKGGTPLLALDVPFSACADTLMVPAIAIDQMAHPGKKYKSAMQAAGEGLAQSMTNNVVMPVMTQGMIQATSDLQQQQLTSPAAPAPTNGN